MKSQAGLTIVELMVGLVIMGMLLVLIIPSFSDYVRNNQIRSLADELQASLQEAKYEAIKRNTRTNMLIADSGWSIKTLPNGNQPEELLREYRADSASPGIIISAANNTISFNSQGRLADSSSNTIDVRAQQNSDCISQKGHLRCLRLQISTAGQIRLCDPSLASTDPRSCG